METNSARVSCIQVVSHYPKCLTSKSPVGLKEAALDSPTFRSGVSHFADQVDLIERWLETWLKSVMRMTQEAGTLEGIINGFLSQTIPPMNVSEAVLDHDYTMLALKSYGEGVRDLWTSTISGMRKMEANMVEPVRSLVQNDIRAFKACLSTFTESFGLSLTCY